MSIEQSADYLLSRTSCRPTVGIVCGSGLSELSECMTSKDTYAFKDIPGFGDVSVPGHTGELVFGLINDVQCVCMRGRFHYYEGNSMEQVVHPVKVMRLLGVKLLIVTNAAGGLNPDYNVGDIMVIQDHYGQVTLAGHHPLRGANDELMGPRFPSMSDAYDERLQEMVALAAVKLNMADRVRLNGTYAFACGPSYESMAEVRFLTGMGCDSVGASTVPEVIAAKHCGMQILGLSLITNACVTHKSDPVANHEDVLAAVTECATRVEALVQHIVCRAVLGAYLAALPSFIYVPSTYGTPAPSRGASGRAPQQGTHTQSQSQAGSSAAEKKAFDPDTEDEFNNAIVSVLALGAIVAGLFIVLRRK